jgi:hypothetical protein
MRLLFLSAVLATSFSACRKADQAPSVPFKMTLQVLTEQGIETTMFTAGQNQVFRLTLTNTGDQELVFDAPLFDASTFLAVEGTSPAGSANYRDFGKPYQRVFCDFVGAYVVPAHGSRVLTIGWLDTPTVATSPSFCGHATTASLPTGHYRTSFTPTLTWTCAQQSSAKSSLPTISQEFNVR